MFRYEDALKCMKERRSVNKFRPEQITEKELSAILEAGTYAPTGRNLMAPTIVVVQDAETIRQISRLNARVMGKEDIDPFYGAPTLAIIFSDPEINPNTYLHDGCAVITNMLNAAYAVGVEARWIHRAKEVFESEEGKALLRKWGLKDTLVGVANCIIGYAACDYPAAKPRKENYIVRV